jgi:hypothetical protein
MLTLPNEYSTLILSFAPLFSRRVWRHVQVLLLGAILAPAKRTVPAVRRVLGLSRDPHYQNTGHKDTKVICVPVEFSVIRSHCDRCPT